MMCFRKMMLVLLFSLFGLSESYAELKCIELIENTHWYKAATVLKQKSEMLLGRTGGYTSPSV